MPSKSQPPAVQVKNLTGYISKLETEVEAFKVAVGSATPEKQPLFNQQLIAKEKLLVSARERLIIQQQLLNTAEHKQHLAKKAEQEKRGKQEAADGGPGGHVQQRGRNWSGRRPPNSSHRGQRSRPPRPNHVERNKEYIQQQLATRNPPPRKREPGPSGHSSQQSHTEQKPATVLVAKREASPQRGLRRTRGQDRGVSPPEPVYKEPSRQRTAVFASTPAVASRRPSSERAARAAERQRRESSRTRSCSRSESKPRWTPEEFQPPRISVFERLGEPINTNEEEEEEILELHDY